MIVAGFGYRNAATAASLRDALRLASGTYRVDALSAPMDKTQARCLTELAAELNLPVHPIDADALQSVATPTQAPRVIEKRGTGSVAEACALAAAGAQSQLITTRCISPDRMATCALATSDLAISDKEEPL